MITKQIATRTRVFIATGMTLDEYNLLRLGGRAIGKLDDGRTVLTYLSTVANRQVDPRSLGSTKPVAEGELVISLTADEINQVVRGRYVIDRHPPGMTYKLNGEDRQLHLLFFCSDMVDGDEVIATAVDRWSGLL